MTNAFQYKEPNQTISWNKQFENYLFQAGDYFIRYQRKGKDINAILKNMISPLLVQAKTLNKANEFQQLIRLSSRIKALRNKEGIQDIMVEKHYKMYNQIIEIYMVLS